MQAIMSYCFSSLSERCITNHRTALAQAIYVQHREPNVIFPPDVNRIMWRDEIREFAKTAIGENWGDGTEFVKNTAYDIELSEDGFGVDAQGAYDTDTKIKLSEDDKAALVTFDAWRRAADLLEIRILSYPAHYGLAKSAGAAIRAHEAEFGSLAFASVDAAYFRDCRKRADDPDAMRLFRFVCAVRSLIGKKRIVGTTKDMLRARIIGAKNKDVASRMIGRDIDLLAGHEDMKSRKRFDRICDLGATRKFYGKFGKFPFINFSLELTTPAAIRDLLTAKKEKRTAYRRAEQAARLEGTGKGHRGDIGGTL